MDEKTILEIAEKIKNKTASDEEITLFMAELKKILAEIKEDLTTK